MTMSNQANRINYLKGNDGLQSFLIALALFACSYLTIGWWTDAYQHMYDTVLSGELTNYYLPAAKDPFPEYMPGAAFVFQSLGNLYPVHWVALSLNSVLFFSVWILFFQVLRHTKQLVFWSRIIIVAFFALLFFESVVLYHMVRITMFAGIAGLSGLIVADEKHFLSKRVLPYLLLFIFALWIRCNVHLFVLLFVSAAFLAHGKSLKPLVPFYIFFTLFFLYYCKVVFWTDYSKDLNFFFLYNLEFKLHHVGAYNPQLHLADNLDSLKYQAVKLDILADEVNLGPEFYERVGAFTNLSKVSTSQFMYAFYGFISAMLENIYFVIADIVLIIFYMVFGGVSTKNYRIKTIGLFLFFYAMIFALCFIKMENRFLVPFQVLFLFTIIILHKPNLFYKKEKLIYLVLFLIIIVPLSGYFIKKKLDFAKDENAGFKKSFEWLGKHYNTSVMVYNTGFVTKNRPYETFYQKDNFKDFYFFNYYATQLSPWYRPFIEKVCICDVGKFYTFYDYLKNRKEEVVLLDYPEREKILSDYLNVVCKSPQHFEKIILPDSVQNVFNKQGFRGKGLSLYGLKKK